MFVHIEYPVGKKMGERKIPGDPIRLFGKIIVDGSFRKKKTVDVPRNPLG